MRNKENLIANIIIGSTTVILLTLFILALL